MNEHTEGALNVDAKLRLIKVESVLSSSTDVPPGHNHVRRLDVGIVSEQAIVRGESRIVGWLQEPTLLEFLLQGRLVEGIEIGGGARKPEFNVKEVPTRVADPLHVQSKLLLPE